MDNQLPDFFFPVWIQKDARELKITPFYHESAWKNGSQVLVRHLSKSTRALPEVTMVPRKEASTCSSSKQETRGATGLLHMGPETPKGLISKQLFPT